jgi:hypothetical protein
LSLAPDISAFFEMGLAAMAARYRLGRAQERANEIVSKLK